MTLFRWFILRHLRRQPLRSGATVLGIALGVSVVVAIRLANTSSIAGFVSALEAMSGRTSLEILGPGAGIDERRLRDLGWLREWGRPSPVIEGDVMVPAGGSPRGEILHVLGVDILRDQAVRDYTLLDFTRGSSLGGAGSAGSARDSVSGAPAREPAADNARGAGDSTARGEGLGAARSQNGVSSAGLASREFLSLLVDPHAVILTERFARRHGLRLGASVPFVIGDRRQSFEIRGLLKDEGPARALDGNIALMDIAAAQWALDRLGLVDRVDLRLHDSAAIDRAEAAIASRLPAGLQVQRPERRGRQVEKMLAAFQMNLAALSYIALLVGLFLVYNTVSTSVIVRREEIGTLRAIGTTRVHVLAMFLTEALVLAVPGCALGIGLGRLLSHVAVALTRTTVNVLYVAGAAAPPALGWSDVVLGFGVGVPLSLLAATLPAVEGSRVPPMAAIRGADRLETRYRLRWWRFAAPAGFVGLAAFLATRSPVAGVPVGGYASALALVFGAAFLVPLIVFGLGRLGRTFAHRLRVEGWLANANLMSAIPRLSVSIAALAVALSMMVAIAVMVGSFRETVIYWVGQTLRADLFIGPATRSGGARLGTISPEVVGLVARHPAVLAIDRVRNMSIPYEDGQIFLGTSDFEVLLAHGNLLFKQPENGRVAMRAAIGTDAVVVSEALALKYGKRVGDTISLLTQDGAQTFRVTAIYFDYASDRGQVLMDRTTFARHFGALNPMGLSVYLQSGSDPERMRTELVSSLRGDSWVFIHTNRSLRAQVLRIFDSTFAITYALEVIAVVVAILGVAATLLTLVLERRKELAMLRLIGADRRQVRAMVVLEAALIGGVSQAVGLVVGIMLSLVLIFVVNVQSFGWTIQFRLPVAFLLQMSTVMLVATALAGLYPARIAARFSVASEVVEE